MKETVITVTEAARNFAECVNRAHYQNLTLFCSRTDHLWHGWLRPARKFAQTKSWLQFCDGRSAPKRSLIAQQHGDKRGASSS